MHKNKWIQNSEIIENDNQISMLHQKIDNFVELTENVILSTFFYLDYTQ